MVAAPVTTPDMGSMVALAVLPLLHAPPVTASDKAVAAPLHTGAEDKIIVAGVAFTVTDLVWAQPAALV